MAEVECCGRGHRLAFQEDNLGRDVGRLWNATVATWSADRHKEGHIHQLRFFLKVMSRPTVIWPTSLYQQGHLGQPRFFHVAMPSLVFFFAGRNIVLLKPTKSYIQRRLAQALSGDQSQSKSWFFPRYEQNLLDYR